MIPILDTTVLATTSTVLTIGPATTGALIALAGCLAWLASGAHQELRRAARRDQEHGPEPHALEARPLAA